MKLSKEFKKDDEQKIIEISKMLSDKPIHLGKSIKDRKAWEELKEKIDTAPIFQKADEFLKREAVTVPDEIYLQYTKIGERLEHGYLLEAQKTALESFTIAECLENKGKYIKQYEAYVKALCSDRTWTINAHDGQLDGFYGRDYIIDLHVAVLSCTLAYCDALLGDAVCSEVRALLRENVERRMINPYLQALKGERPIYHWMIAHNNWNIVCLASCMGAVLAMTEDKMDRALAITAYLSLGKNGLTSYNLDGYAVEEVGYWGYGYSHMVLGMELTRTNTFGAIDLQKEEVFIQTGLFGLRSRISDGAIPCVADWGYGVTASPVNNLYICERLGITEKIGLNKYSISGVNMYFRLLIWFLDAPVLENVADINVGDGIRNYFDSTQVLISRSKKDQDIRMGLYAKGGDNHQSHNHLDVGNFVVCVNGETIISDNGCPPYNASTFGANRYDNIAFNSYGHSVPFIGGFGQKGENFNWLEDHKVKFKAEVLDKEFTDECDSITYNLKEVYDQDFINSLTRKFVHNRANNGEITITDSFDFDSEQEFETAFTTYSKIAIKDKTLVITGEKTGVTIEFSSDDIEFNIILIPSCKTEISNSIVVTPVRVGVKFKNKVKNGALTSVIKPFII